MFCAVFKQAEFELDSPSRSWGIAAAVDDPGDTPPYPNAGGLPEREDSIETKSATGAGTAVAAGAGKGMGTTASRAAGAPVGPSYAHGGLWLVDPKYVAKGFTLRAAFVADWLSVRGALTPQHPWLLPVAAAAAAAAADSR